MIRRLWIQAAAIVLLGVSAGPALTQETGITATFLGTQEQGSSPDGIRPRAIQAVPTPTVILFNAAAVGISSGSAQTLTASFTVSGYTGTFTPTAALHYGLSYSLGAVNCTGGASPETCTVAIKFQPTLPGGRRDALFLMNGTTRLSTVLLYGVGNAPYALMQPGQITQPISASANTFFTSTVDENGTDYVLETQINAVVGITKAGSVTTLPITGLNSPRTIGIDGAGVLYIAGETAGAPLITYDTVQATQGTFPVPGSDLYANIAVGNEGNVYEVDGSTGVLYTMSYSGSTTGNVTLSPSIFGPAIMGVDSGEDVFIGGSTTINEITSGGVQSQINTVGSQDGLTVDAAATLYGTRYSTLGGVAELPASGYSSTLGSLDSSDASPLGAAVGPDGTLYVGNVGSVDKVTRTQGALTFTASSGLTSTAQNAAIYNGGNQALTVSNIVLSGANFTMQSAANNNCTNGIVLSPGAYCQVAVTYTSPHNGSFSGTLTFTSNSLNSSGSTETVALTGNTTGAYLVESSASLSFVPQVMNTTSAAQTITLTNQGLSQSATINTPSGVSGFTIGLGTCTTALAVNASCQLSVKFAPTAPVAYSGTSTVTNSGPSVSFTVAGTGLPVVNETNSLLFNPAAVGIAAGSAQTITASFSITGYSSIVAPTAAMHYGTSYSVGAVNCSGSAGAQTCTVPVTFQPIYPGGRRDALFLAVGSTRIASVLAYGIGQAPFALVQPGVITNPIVSNPNYLYTSEVDENGTAYVLETGANAVFAVTKAGVVTTLPITGLNSPRGLGIDGAGVLYFADQTFNGPTITYDTVQGIQGTVAFPASIYVQTLAVGNTGNLYETDDVNVYTVPISGTGTASTKAISPAITQASAMTVDSNENVFLAGYTINEITSGGVQTEINTIGGGSGLGVDAADSLYSSRYGISGSDSVGELPASNYATDIAVLDPAANPLGSSVGPDGTVYVGNYSNLDKVDRSQGAIAFGQLASGSTSAVQNVGIYNGGNESLTISSIVLTGAAFTLQVATSNNCTNGIVIAPGAFCQVAATFTSPHGGIYSGSITFTSNSLNVTSTQTVALSGSTSGAYVASPSSLTFPAQTVNTTSATQNITLTNSGESYNATFLTPQVGNSVYSVGLGTCIVGLAPGTSCQLSITFTPAAVQSYNNVSVTIPVSSSGGQSTPSVTFTLSGTGIAALAPVVSLVPTPIAFGTQNIGTTSPTQTILLSNTGNAALNLTGSGISLAGTNPTSFSQTNNCGTSVAAGASCNISVSFSPGAVQAYSASISVVDNAAGTPQTVPLTGTGVARYVSQLQFTPAQLNAIAGTGVGTAADTGDGGPALSATFNTPFGVAQDASGNIYVADQANNYVRKFSVNGTITAFAGIPNTGSGTFSGDNGQATSANLSQPIGVAVDASGNVYIADYGNSRIRKVVPSTGIITTFAGTGSGFFSGGTATSVPIPGPEGITFDAAGNMYIACVNQQIVVKINQAGTATLFAGVLTGSGPGNVGYNGDNILAINAWLAFPQDVAADQAGNIFIADTANNRIRKVAASTGIITTVAGNGTAGDTGDNGPAASAEIYAFGVATDLAGDLFITSTNPAMFAAPYASVRKVDVNGNITTVAGAGTGSTGGEATAAQLGDLGLVGVGNNGTLLLPAYRNPYQVLSAGPAGYVQFGNQAVGIASAPQTVTFENTGDATLTLSQTTYTASSVFSVTGGTCAGLTALAPGATCTLTVTFTPTSAIAFTGSIGVNSNGTIGAQTITLAGTGTAALLPQAMLSPNPVAFPNTVVGVAAATMPLTLSNPGTAALTITSISVTGANASSFSESNNCGSSVAAGGSCTITVGFTPGSAAALTAAISVADNASGSPQSATLTGTGTAALVPQATLSPNPVAFPSTTVGVAASTLPLTLSNPGTAALTITSISVTGANASSFSQSNNCGSSVAAGGSCTVTVGFTPGSAAALTASISVADNATGSPQTATLTGTGTAPQSVLSPNPLAFPGTTVGVAASTLPLTLSNPGNAALTVTSISVSGTNASSFSQTNNCGSSVAAGGTCTITVGFTPGSAAVLTASISVADNATGSPQSSMLTGTGTAPLAPLAVLSPNPLAFPSTTVGVAASTLPLTLSNPGNAALTIASISVTGTNATSFSESTNCGSSVAAGGTCTITVGFTPGSAAALTAAISVADNASGSPQSATLTGTGIAAVPTFTVTTSTPSASVMPGAVAMYNITVAPLGGSYNNVVTLTATGLPAGAQYAFVPPSVTPGSAGAPSVLSIQLPAGQARLAEPAPPGQSSLPLYAVLAGLPLLGLAGARRRLRGTSGRWKLLAIAVLSVLPMLALSGCGGGYFGKTGQNYTVTIIGTSGSLQESTTISLTVQ